MNNKRIYKAMAILLTFVLLLSLSGPTSGLALLPAEDCPSIVLVNTPPVAVLDDYEVETNTTLTVPAPGVLENDYDPDGDPITADLTGGVSHGTLVLNADGSFTYTPDPDYVGQDYFTYRAYDGIDYSNPVQVTIEVFGENDPPVAVADDYQVEVNTTLTEPAPGVLENDYDPDGDPFTAELVNYPANGTLTLNEDGSFIYTPDPDYVGTDYFTYRAYDEKEYSNPAQVSIEVYGENEPPLAVGDNYEVEINTTLTVTADIGVLINDYDPDGDALTALLLGGASHGFLTFYTDGSFIYEPDPDYSGTDYFTYQAYDGYETSSPVMVAIEVTSENTAPVAMADNYETSVGISLTVPAPGVLANDIDVDGDELIADLLGGAVHGILTFNPDGSFVYIPDANYVGTDYFTYRAFDGHENSNPVQVSIEMIGQNTAPTAVADDYDVNEDTTLTVAAPGVLANDSDPNGDSLTAVLVGSTAQGTLTFHADGSFVYNPYSGYVGDDHFTYKASDGVEESTPVMVVIHVLGDNSIPVAVADTYDTYVGATLTVNAANGVLANDSDADGDTLTVQLSSSTAQGTLTLRADGSFVYVPKAGYVGDDHFTYQAYDGEDYSTAVMVTIHVNAYPYDCVLPVVAK